MKLSLLYFAFMLAASCAHAQTSTPSASPPIAKSAPLPLTPEHIERLKKTEAGQAGFLAFRQKQRELTKKAGFSGEVGMAYASYSLQSYDGSSASVVAAQDSSGKVLEAGRVWRWASVTKQVIAVLVMQEVAMGRIDLEKPVSLYLPNFLSPNARKMTVRQLLRHQSGLPNPDDTSANSEGVPSYYTTDFKGSKDPVTGYCAGTPKTYPGGNWSYNNCDYIVAGALLEAVTGRPWQTLIKERLERSFKKTYKIPSIGTVSSPTRALLGIAGITTTPPSIEAWPGFVGGKPEAKFDISSFGAAGAVYGSVSDLLQFDIYLTTGQLLPQSAMTELWNGRPELGFLALGQWSFEAALNGCNKPVRIVERRGSIGGVQVRNFIVPEQEIAVALFTDQAEFDFGEIWQSKGFSYDMLSLAACAKANP
ncbi:MAG: serine hydrolase domain-containing protein [Sphingomonadaceae bacterium]